MSFGLLFSGQGTQHAAMMPWLAEDEHVAGMRARLGVNDWRRSLEDPAWAARNANAQTLLTGLALAAWAQLAPMVPSPAPPTPLRTLCAPLCIASACAFDGTTRQR
jgi:[acyl-carrier-protein] S-malonyltransferase